MKILNILSLVLNIILILAVALLIVSIYAILHPEPDCSLGFNYQYSPHRHSIEINTATATNLYTIYYDDFLNFEDYIVVKKKYDGSEIVGNWSSESSPQQDNTSDKTIPENELVPGNTYYYIIAKRNNVLIGPLTYRDCVAICSDMGIKLF